jgi:hypothetical protein
MKGVACVPCPAAEGSPQVPGGTQERCSRRAQRDSVARPRDSQDRPRGARGIVRRARMTRRGTPRDRRTELVGPAHRTCGTGTPACVTDPRSSWDTPVELVGPARERVGPARRRAGPAHGTRRTRPSDMRDPPAELVDSPAGPRHSPTSLPRPAHGPVECSRGDSRSPKALISYVWRRPLTTSRKAR